MSAILFSKTIGCRHVQKHAEVCGVSLDPAYTNRRIYDVLLSPYRAVLAAVAQVGMGELALLLRSIGQTSATNSSRRTMVQNFKQCSRATHMPQQHSTVPELFLHGVKRD